MNQYIHSNGYKIWYSQEGRLDSPHSIVFLNGVFHGKESWVKQYRDKFLKQNYRLVFLDYRDCGRSVCTETNQSSFGVTDIYQDILQVIRQLELEKPALIGYSLGGLFALDLVTLYPQNFSKLILLNTSHRISLQGQKMILSARRMLAEDVALETLFSAIYPWFFDEGYLRKLADFEPQILAKYANYNQNRLGLVRFIDAVWQRFQKGTVAWNSQLPSLLISADDDQICPTPLQKELLDYLPGSEWAQVKGGGHASNIEKYKQVNRHIVEFLQEQNNEKITGN